MAATLVNYGEEWVSERLAGVQGTGTNNVTNNAGTHIGIGTGTTAEAKTQTALTTEVESRATTTVTVSGGTGASAVYSAAGAAITATATRAISEAGLFNASTTGVMFIRATFATINLATNDTLAVTFTIDPS